MQVKEFMKRDLVWTTPENTVYNAAKLMQEKHVGSVVICDNEQKVQGIITDRDIVLRTVACDKDLKNIKISEVMTRDVITAVPETNIQEAMKRMSENQVRRLPVVDNEKTIGIISLGDLALSEKVTETNVGKTFEWICGCGCNKQKNGE